LNFDANGDSDLDFQNQCYGSVYGILCFFLHLEPVSRMEKKFQFLLLGSAIYKKDQISKSLGLKMNKFFVADPEPFDSESGMEKF
jgi:hypothetical protein